MNRSILEGTLSTDGFFAWFKLVLHCSTKKRQFWLWNFWSRLKIAPAHCGQASRNPIVLTWNSILWIILASTTTLRTRREAAAAAAASAEREREAHQVEEEEEDCGRLIWNAKPFPLKALGLLESFVQKFFPTIFIIDSYMRLCPGAIVTYVLKSTFLKWRIL